MTAEPPGRVDQNAAVKERYVVLSQPLVSANRFRFGVRADGEFKMDGRVRFLLQGKLPRFRIQGLEAVAENGVPQDVPVVVWDGIPRFLAYD